jgi:hypothetical protein
MTASRSQTMSADLVTRCRHLADLHGGIDLSERVGRAMADQLRQRQALTEAADEIERLRTELQEARAAAVASCATSEA